MSLRRLPNRRQCGETMNLIWTGCSISMDAACARDLLWMSYDSADMESKTLGTHIYLHAEFAKWSKSSLLIEILQKTNSKFPE